MRAVECVFHGVIIRALRCFMNFGVSPVRFKEGCNELGSTTSGKPATPVRQQRMCVRETGRGGGGSERERGRERGGIYHVMILPVLTAKDRGQPRLSHDATVPAGISRDLPLNESTLPEMAHALRNAHWMPV